MAVRLVSPLLCACALVALPSLAQAQLRLPAGTLPAATAARPAAPPPVRTAAATGRGAAPTTVVQAAGSVIVLADGIVANASMAQIAPPAPGFEYER